jgi:hypothetical protein
VQVRNTTKKQSEENEQNRNSSIYEEEILYAPQNSGLGQSLSEGSKRVAA